MKIGALMLFLVTSLTLQGAEMDLTSQAFKDSGSIPAKYTCDGDNISPPLKWGGAPKETKSFVLIVDDPDAPSKVWTHWVVYNIPSSITESQEGSFPKGALQGVNDFGHMEYGGPCPPSGTHRYYFKLYALDDQLKLPQGASKQQVEKEIKPHILAQAQLMGKYSRK